MRQIRLDRGLTQAQLAEYAGCDPQTVQRAEAGRYGLSLRRLEAIASGLGVGVGELFADVSTAVPASPWTSDDSKVATIWKRVPKDRRDVALRVLTELTR